MTILLTVAPANVAALSNVKIQTITHGRPLESTSTSNLSKMDPEITSNGSITCVLFIGSIKRWNGDLDLCLHREQERLWDLEPHRLIRSGKAAHRQEKACLDGGEEDRDAIQPALLRSGELDVLPERLGGVGTL